MKNKLMFSILAFAAMTGVVTLWLAAENLYTEKTSTLPKVAPVRADAGITPVEADFNNRVKPVART